MTFRYLMATVGIVLGTAALAEEADTPSRGRDLLRARRAEEAKQTPPAPAPAPARESAATPAGPTNAEHADHPSSAGPVKVPAPASPAPTAGAAKAKARTEPATVLPKVEVKKGRITELDQQLAEQEKAIARERKNTKTTDVDKTLNDSKIATPLSIFGGESSQFRQRVANERISLMEDEKDLIEAIAHAKTKQEKAELKRQLNILRAHRRELDKTLR